MTDKEWISVEDKIPEGKAIICFKEPFFGEYTSEVGVGYFDEESKNWLFWINDSPVRGPGVTHWMPIPDAP